MKMELLTNATVVDDAIRFASSNITNKQGIIATTYMDNIHNHGSEEYEVEKNDLPHGKKLLMLVTLHPQPIKFFRHVVSRLQSIFVADTSYLSLMLPVNYLMVTD